MSAHSKPRDGSPSGSAAGKSKVEALGRRFNRQSKADATHPAMHVVLAPKAILERKTVTYEQNCESFRSLNQLMWQIPLIAMSLTGGLWYGVSNTSLHRSARIGLLVLAAVADASLGLLVLPRVRRVMQGHLDKMREYAAGFAVAAKSRIPVFGGNGGTKNVYASLLVLVAVTSAYAAKEVWTGSMRNAPSVTIVERTTTIGPTGVTTTEVTKTVTTTTDAPRASANLPSTIPPPASATSPGATTTLTPAPLAPAPLAPTPLAPTPPAPMSPALTQPVPTMLAPTTQVPATPAGVGSQGQP